MKCERARELFSEYVEGSIDYALTATVRSHIDQCDDCRSELMAFRRAWDVIGTLPEVEPPSSFRHDVVMRAARMQHEQRKSARPVFLSVIWDLLFRRLLPARAVAVAVAGALLAVIILNIGPGVVTVFEGNGLKVSRIHQINNAPADATQAYAKTAWKSRNILSNALWVSLEFTDFGDGNSYCQLGLTINNDALARGTTNRIPAQVYILPPNKFGVEAGGPQKPVWSGNVLGESPVHVAVPSISSSSGKPTPVTLLITYQFRKMNFAKIVFIPTDNTCSASTDAIALYNGGATLTGRDLYDSLQTVSQSRGLAIIANGSLHRRAGAVDLRSTSNEDVMRNMLEPIDLAWAFIDNAVYVDREFRNTGD